MDSLVQPMYFTVIQLYILQVNIEMSCNIFKTLVYLLSNKYSICLYSNLITSKYLSMTIVKWVSCLTIHGYLHCK